MCSSDLSWAQHMLTNWIGDAGFLHRLRVSVRQPNLVGDTIWWRGRVTGKRVEGDHHVVAVDLRATNQRDSLSAEGEALVVLPGPGQDTVPLPIPQSLAGPAS